MATFMSPPTPTPTPTLSFKKTNLPLTPTPQTTRHSLFSCTPNLYSTFQSSRHSFSLPAGAKDASLGPLNLITFAEDKDDGREKEATLPIVEEQQPLKFLFWVLFWASLSVAWFAASGDADAAVDSIRASGFGRKIGAALRGSGWPDEVVVFALATLPVIELRGAIPVGYWMQLKPSVLTVLSVLGNMVPVPFIILYLKRLSSYLSGRNRSVARVLDMVFLYGKEKAGPVVEFQWLGLMLFVAVPFPGTGAWTGAIIASLLDMPFWSAVSANFCGIVMAGLLVNLLVCLGVKYAIVTGIVLFFLSTIMWNLLRSGSKLLSS